MVHKFFSSMYTPNVRAPRGTKLLLLVGWVLAFFGSWASFSPPVVPKPSEVLAATVDLWMHGGLFQEILVSLTLNLEAMAISTIVSLGLVYLTVIQGVRLPVAFLSRLRFLGFTGLTFLFGLFVQGHALKLWMLVFGMSVFYITAMAGVVGSINKSNYDYARTLRMGPWRAVWEVVVRGTFDQALEILSQNVAMGWVMLTFVEGLVRSEGGLGALMLNENKHFKLDAVFAIQFHILALGIGLDALFVWLKQVLCPYSVITKERS